MARLNEILVGRFNRTYQKVFGIKGSPPVASLAPEIMPTHAVFHGAEDRYLEGWNRAAFTANIVGNAGQNAAFQLRNPANSNLIVVVEFLTFGSSTAQVMQAAINFTGADLASPGVGVTLDGRQTSIAMAIPSTQLTSTAIGNVIMTQNNTANLPFIPINCEDQELVLTQSRALLVEGTSVATQLLLNIIWRERFLEEGERL